MSKQDSDEIRQLLKDVLATHTAEINGQFNLIKQELSFIKEQTIKTNGRVNKHDELFQKMQLSEKDHFQHCPNTTRIEALEDVNVGKKSVDGFIIKVGGFFGAAILIVIAVIELIIKK